MTDNSNRPEPTRINLDAPIHARELTEREFRAALRDISRNLRWRRPPLPSIGEILRAREAEKVK